mgnify:CR=1 FL=1
MTKLVYFAWVRERIGKGEEEIDLPAAVKTGGDLLRHLKTLGENSSRMMGCCGHIAPRNGRVIPPKIRFLTMYVNRTLLFLTCAQ